MLGVSDMLMTYSSCVLLGVAYMRLAQEYVVQHNIAFSTDPDLTQSKTKGDKKTLLWRWFHLITHTINTFFV